MRLRRLLIAILALAIGTLASCSKQDDGRHRISGTVSYDNKPMPYGEVLFTPDGAQNNSGPQGIAYIRDGKFDSTQNQGKGYAGGPTVVRVTGLSQPNGGVICEYEYSVDLPRGTTTLDIVVPEKEIRKGPSKEI